MKAISIRQPFVERILTGAKVREYRSRACNIRGRVLLHASMTVDHAECQQLIEDGSFAPDYEFWIGAILGSVEVVGCEPDPENGFAWLLANAIRFAEPLPYRGKVGWFEVPDELALNLQ